MDRKQLFEDLRPLIAPGRIATDELSLSTYGKDWTEIPPAPLAIAFPQSIPEIQTLVGFANNHRLGLVPSGGRTGLSGGAVAAHGEMVISFRDLNRILEFDPVERSVRVEAGVVTRTLQGFAAEKGLLFPLELGSSGASQIGGNIATNAGGVKVIRYGPIRDWVTGLIVVTGKGDVLHLNRGLMKNATGYDLRHLFIGSEGTLGLIAEATLRLTSQPGPRSVILLGLPDLSGILEILSAFREAVLLNAFEFFCERSLQYVTAAQKLGMPFEGAYPFYALIDFEHPDEPARNAALAVAERVIGQGWARDAVAAQDEADCRRLWRLRESITESIAPYGPYKNDLSVSPSQVPGFLAAAGAVVRESYPGFEVLWYGHIGDGNLHLNILPPPGMAREEFVRHCESVNDRVFRLVESYGGSVSAEHGVGLLKRQYLRYSRSEVEIAAMRAIKAVFDPNGILNPGKIFQE